MSRLNRRGFRLLMVADSVVLASVAVVSMVLRYGVAWPTYPWQTYFASFSTIVALFFASLYFGGLYEREARLGVAPVMPRVARQTLAAGGLVALLRLAVQGVAQSRGLPDAVGLAIPIPNLLLLIVGGALAVSGNRWLSTKLRLRREGSPRVVLAGGRDDLQLAREQLQMDPDAAQLMAEVERPAELVDAVIKTRASEVVLLTGGWVEELYPETVWTLERLGVSVLLRVTARETLYGLERVREVGGLPFVLLRAQTMRRSRAHFKRFFDLVVLAATAPFWCTLLMLLALYQLAVVGRPILYRQVRIGAGEHSFILLKFRTMGVDAEADGRGARLAEVDDPRVLRGCMWLRETRMDELPQLWNVARGEMSLVGPRPERPELTAGFERRIAGYSRRHELPPGLTGLAQIQGRYHTDAESKLGYDLQYLVNWSPILDLEILLKTIVVVLLRRL